VSSGSRSLATGDGYPPPGRAEPHWPPQLTVTLAIALQFLLPDRVEPGPRWLVPALEAVMLAALLFASPQKLVGEHMLRRRVALVTSGIVSAANGISLGLLCSNLLHHNVSNGKQLIIAGALIWLTNVLVFALWYWESDRGGPGRRAAGNDEAPDFQFPQMSDERTRETWRPVFIDYLYVSLTNATAFSPTDTMPLTGQAKSLMGLQSLISLVTLGLVVSRAVNIL
jgi:uncharacterized membrane protein